MTLVKFRSSPGKQERSVRDADVLTASSFLSLVDLSKNRLVEVPMELCHFVSLEILNLYHNCIRVIPEAIVNLQMLTYLNLR